MFDKMKQLMEMKKQADRIKKELDALVVDIEEVSGIKISITGSQVFRSVNIDDSKVSDKSRLESDLLRSVNAAVRKSQQVAAQKMRDVMPGFPGM